LNCFLTILECRRTNNPGKANGGGQSRAVSFSADLNELVEYYHPDIVKCTMRSCLAKPSPFIDFFRIVSRSRSPQFYCQKHKDQYPSERFVKISTEIDLDQSNLPAAAAT
jgi:hypothetical protein